MIKLFDLAKVTKVNEMKRAMFSGEKINFTEDRAVFHVALRHQGDQMTTGGKNVMPDVRRVQAQMKDSVSALFCIFPRKIVRLKFFYFLIFSKK